MLILAAREILYTGPLNWDSFFELGFTAGHNLPDKNCVADTAMQIELS